MVRIFFIGIICILSVYLSRWSYLYADRIFFSSYAVVKDDKTGEDVIFKLADVETDFNKVCWIEENKGFWCYTDQLCKLCTPVIVFDNTESHMMGIECNCSAIN
jgi:hypothetical protein